MDNAESIEGELDSNVLKVLKDHIKLIYDEIADANKPNTVELNEYNSSSDDEDEVIISSKRLELDDTLEEHLNLATLEIKNLKKENQELQAKLKLESDTRSTINDTPILEQLKTLKESFANLKTKNTQLEDTAQNNAKAIQERETTIQELNTQIADESKKLDNLQEQLDSVSSELESQKLIARNESSLREKAEEDKVKALEEVRVINEALNKSLAATLTEKDELDRREAAIFDLEKRVVAAEKDNEESKLLFDKNRLEFERSSKELRELAFKSASEKEGAELLLKDLTIEIDKTKHDLLNMTRLIDEKEAEKLSALAREAAALKAQREAEELAKLKEEEIENVEAERDAALDDVDRIRIEIVTANLARQKAENERNEERILKLEAEARTAAALKAQRDAEAETTHVAGRINILTQHLGDIQNLLQERTDQRDDEAALKLAAEGREAAEIALKNAAILNLGNMAIDRDAERLAKNQALANVIRVGGQRAAALNDLGIRTGERNAALIDAADQARLRLDAERLKALEENAKRDALARLTASERNLSDLQKSSNYETSVARSQRDKALEDIERLQRSLEKQSSAPEHKIIREFEKTFKPNYNKASDLLFVDKTEKEKNIEIDYYRNHRHKIYQDDDTKLAHTKIDLGKASDEEIIREIAKDRERAVRNSLPKLVAKLIGQKNKESIIENLSRTDIVIALSVGNNQEFDQWKKDNPDANIGATFFGKLEKGSEAQKIRSKAVENLLEGIKGYAAFFGVDDSEEKENSRPNRSPKIHHLSKLSDDSIAHKMESRNQSIANRQKNLVLVC